MAYLRLTVEATIDPAMTFEEIAQALGMKKNNVYDAYVKGMRKLSQHPERLQELQRLVDFRRGVVDRQLHI
jgi:predicted DNA-binding protein YlxM (UPF0122 family)